jgi:hypothetical protein
MAEVCSCICFRLRTNAHFSEEPWTNDERELTSLALLQEVQMALNLIEQRESRLRVAEVMDMILASIKKRQKA